MTRPAARRATALGMLPAVAALLLAGCTGPEPAPTGTPDPTAETTSLTDVVAGDCTDEAERARVRVVDCAEPHDAEVFASFVLTEPAYDRDAIGASATIGCEEAFGAFVGLEFEASELGLRYVAPSEATWAQGDREVLCVVFDPAGTTAGTLEGSVR